MIPTGMDLKKWKREQLQYFRQYLGYFEKGSREHTRLKKAMDDLENSI